jgi:hypothetical protein
MECKNNMIVKFDDGTCILEAGIPAKFGKDLQASALTVKPCADTICDVCSDNYLMCTQCPSATALLAPDLGKCYLLSDLSSMPHKYGKKSDGNSGYKLARCYDNKCIDCYENYSKCTVCEISHIVDGFSRCIFKSRGTIGKATVRAPVAKLVTIPMFERSRNTFVYTKIGVALRIITNILLPYDIFSRVSAFVIDRMFSHLTLASVQGSYKYIMSRMGLRYVQFGRRTALPFLNLDPNRESTDCHPTDAMLIAGEHCDFLVNYGDNAMGLAIILGFMISIDLMYMFLHSKLSCSPTKSFHFFLYMTLKTFGIRFFVAKMEAVSMEVVFHFFTNLYTLKTSNVGGFILGLIMTLFILIQIVLCIWVAKTLAPLAENQRYNVNPGMDILDMKHAKQPDHKYFWRVISMMWVGMRPHIGKHAVYYPIVSMIRMFLLGLIVGMFTDSSSQSIHRRINISPSKFCHRNNYYTKQIYLHHF